MRIGIDATSIVSSGGLTHLFELVNCFDHKNHSKIKSIKIFASKKVLDFIPDKPIVSKHTFWFLNSNKFFRIFFQLFFFTRCIDNKIDVLFSITGDYTGSFKPLVGMSQNMLLYERDQWKEIRSIKEKTKFFLNYLRQKKCFNNSQGIIFISKYARNYILNYLSLNHKNTEVINHGISKNFINQNKFFDINFSINSNEKPFKFLYVSSIHTYKNHCNVIKAIDRLRKKKYLVTLTLIGKVIFNNAGNKMNNLIQKLDPEGNFIQHIESVSYEEMPKKYSNHNGIIFASTCENMPNILIESMASTKPIACSDKSPMPEFLRDGGYYFDAKSVNSITTCLETMLNSSSDYGILANKNLKEINKYNWEKTSTETFNYLSSINY